MGMKFLKHLHNLETTVQSWKQLVSVELKLQTIKLQNSLSEERTYVKQQHQTQTGVCMKCYDDILSIIVVKLLY